METENDETEHAFVISSSKMTKYARCNGIHIDIGGVRSNVLIDSRTSCNVTDHENWEFLKEAGIQCTSEKESKPLYVYGSPKPLRVAGTFQTTVPYGDKETTTEFLVVDRDGQTLLCQETATELGLLQIDPLPAVNSVEMETNRQEFKSDPSDLGKKKYKNTKKSSLFS